MNPIVYNLKFEKMNKFLVALKNERNVNKLGNEIYIRNRNQILNTKIRTSKKYRFQRIRFNMLIEKDNVWFAKYPNTDDLMIIKKESQNLYTLYFYLNQWKYRFLFLGNIKSNLNNLL